MPINSLMSIQSNNYSGVVIPPLPYALCWYDMNDSTNLFDISGHNISALGVKVKTVNNKAVQSPNVNNLVACDVSVNYTTYTLTNVNGVGINGISNASNTKTGFKTDGFTDISGGFAVMMILTPQGANCPYWCKFTTVPYPFSFQTFSRSISNGTSTTTLTSSFSTFTAFTNPILFYNDFNATTMKYNEYVDSSGTLINGTSLYYADISSNPLFIGTKNAVGWGAYKFYEMLVFPSPLSTTERQIVEGWLATKYNLLGNLPAAHPYKGGYFGTNPLH